MAALTIACVGTSAAKAVTVNVNTTLATSTQGDGLCSIAEAVDYADGGTDKDCSAAAPSGTTTIDVPAGHYLIPATLVIKHATDVVASGSGSTDIDGGGTHQVIIVEPTVVVSLSGVTVSGGATIDYFCKPLVGSPCQGQYGQSGGGIENMGSLTLNDVTVAGNTTASGGIGSFVLPTLCLGGCPQVPGQDGGGGGDGAGIYNAPNASLTIQNSTISGNRTGAGGAGIAGVSGLLLDAGAGAQGGNGGDGGYGGGIYSGPGATLTIMNSTVSGNSTGAGGSAGAGTNATLIAGATGGNSGTGGAGGAGAGIYSEGTLNITGSTLSGNTAGAGGASALPGSGSGSSANGSTGQAGDGGFGAALTVDNPGGAALVNSTIASNAAGPAGGGQNAGNPGSGGAIDNLSFTGTSLTNVTIADNTAGEDAAIAGPGGRPLTETDTLVASNANTIPGSESCTPDQIHDGGHDVAWQASGCAGVTRDPKLGSLADNGGATETISLGSGSSAIDLVPVSSCIVTTDQRGIGRPVGAGCDAGAYESAPPLLAAVAASVTGPQTATITGQVTPNLTHANVTVVYGTTTSYGSTATTDAGSGAGATPFAVSLSGLAPGTTYHAKVVVANTDGTTSSQDLTLTTPVAATVAFSPQAVVGSVATVRLTCAAHGPACSGAIKLTSRVTSRGRKVVAIAASGLKGAGFKRRTKTELVGGGSYALAAGSTETVKLTLNRTGRRLLKARRHLPAIATFTGSLTLRKRVSFAYRQPRKTKARV